MVSTWLGRTSPPPPETWHRTQRRASEADAGEADRRRARRQARDWGRFTRNFVVQGTAAEWALCWLADLRVRLRVLADDGAAAVRAAAAEAGRLLFGSFPVDFPLDVAVVDSYAEAG